MMSMTVHTEPGTSTSTFLAHDFKPTDLIAPWSFAIKQNSHLWGNFPFSEIKYRSFPDCNLCRWRYPTLINEYLWGMYLQRKRSKPLLLDEIKQCQWFFHSDIGECFDFHIYHNNFCSALNQNKKKIRKRKKKVRKCEITNMHSTTSTLWLADR